MIWSESRTCRVPLLLFLWVLVIQPGQISNWKRNVFSIMVSTLVITVGVDKSPYYLQKYYKETGFCLFCFFFLFFFRSDSFVPPPAKNFCIISPWYYGLTVVQEKLKERAFAFFFLLFGGAGVVTWRQLLACSRRWIDTISTYTSEHKKTFTSQTSGNIIIP